MYCQKCGTSNTDDARFCVFCGERLNTDSVKSNENDYVKLSEESESECYEKEKNQILDLINEQTQIFKTADEPTKIMPDESLKSCNQQNGGVEYQQISPAPAPQPKNRFDKKIIAAIVVGVVLVTVLVVGLVVAKVSLSKVKMNDYITEDVISVVEISGYDGYGKVEYDDSKIIDYYGIYEALNGDDFGVSYGSDIFDDTDMTLYQRLQVNEQFDDYTKAFDVTFSQTENLKNGDTVTITIFVDYDYINSYFDFDKTLSGDDDYRIDFTVEGLNPMQDIDPFEMVKSVYYDKAQNTVYYEFEQESKTFGDYTLTAKNNYVKIENSDGYQIAIITYTNDEYSGKGKITVKAVVQPVWNEDLAYYGIDAQAINSAVLEVEPNVISLVCEGDNLSKDDCKALKTVADEKINDYEADFENMYFAYNSDAESNLLMFVYSYTQTSKNWYTNESIEEIKYGFVYFKDVKADSENKISGIGDLYAHCLVGYDSVNDITDTIKNDNGYQLSIVHFN